MAGLTCCRATACSVTIERGSNKVKDVQWTSPLMEEHSGDMIYVE